MKEVAGRMDALLVDQKCQGKVMTMHTLIYERRVARHCLALMPRY